VIYKYPLCKYEGLEDFEDRLTHVVIHSGFILSSKFLNLKDMFKFFPVGALSTFCRYIYRYLFMKIDNIYIENLLQLQLLLSCEYLSKDINDLGSEFFLSNLVKGSFDLKENLKNRVNKLVDNFNFEYDEFSSFKLYEDFVIELLNNNSDETLLGVLLIISIHLFYLNLLKIDCPFDFLTNLINKYKYSLLKINVVDSLEKLVEQVLSFSSLETNIDKLKLKIIK